MLRLAVGCGAAVLAPAFASAAVIADWTFETSQPATAGPFSPEVGSGAASGNHPGGSTYSSPAGNGSSHSFSSNTWVVGDYYQYSTSSTGLQNLSVSWDQTSSGTGPANFELDYSTDGSTFTPLATYTVLANAAPNPVWNATTSSAIYTFTDALPASLNNQATIYLRMIDKTTTSAGGGTVASGGTDRMDNVIISGDAIPEPASIGAVCLAGIAAMRRRRR